MRVYMYLLSAIFVALVVMVKGEDTDEDLTEVKDSNVCMLDNDTNTCKSFPESILPSTDPSSAYCFYDVKLGSCKKHGDCKIYKQKCINWKKSSYPLCLNPRGKEGKTCMCCLG
ncbi:hypothetical protein O0L34_g1622 [Tuta absoluta]|nr:hypothetical protein O0L34_g1621 [Tuta absoluta]KAJ2944734.1 hypothetical protein O0L34_g1622 [Tuta absoluta]